MSASLSLWWYGERSWYLFIIRYSYSHSKDGWCISTVYMTPKYRKHLWLLVCLPIGNAADWDIYCFRSLPWLWPHSDLRPLIHLEMSIWWQNQFFCQLNFLRNLINQFFFVLLFHQQESSLTALFISIRLHSSPVSQLDAF